MAGNNAFNNLLGGIEVNTVANNSTLTLTGNSAYTQVVTVTSLPFPPMANVRGTVTLPNASTVPIGRSYCIIPENDGGSDFPATLNVLAATGAVLAVLPVNNSSGANATQGGMSAIFTCCSNTDNQNAWNVIFDKPLFRAANSSITVTFATVGNLTVSYASRSVYMYRTGNLLGITGQIQFTPTYTTSAGNFQIILPTQVSQFTNSGPGITVNGSCAFIGTAPTFPTGCTMVIPQLSGPGSNIVTLQCSGSGAASAAMTVTQFPTATARGIWFTVMIPCFSVTQTT